MKHILAIDDDTNLLKLIEAQLKNLDYKVITAINGEIGFKLAHEGNPDLILLDIMMPVMDGFEVLKQLQRNSLTKNIPVIMLTSKSQKEDVQAAMQMGVVDYIIKPYKIDSFSKKIETAIKYKNLKEAEDADSELVKIQRDTGRTIISFKNRLHDRKMLEEVRRLFSRGFLALTKMDVIVIDLRTLSDLSEDEVPILSRIIEIFAGKTVHIIAGRHYGAIIANSDYDDEKAKIYISSGDLELELDQ